MDRDWARFCPVNIYYINICHYMWSPFKISIRSSRIAASVLGLAVWPLVWPPASSPISSPVWSPALSHYCFPFCSVYSVTALGSCPLCYWRSRHISVYIAAYEPIAFPSLSSLVSSSIYTVFLWQSIRIFSCLVPISYRVWPTISGGSTYDELRYTERWGFCGGNGKRLKLNWEKGEERNGLCSPRDSIALILRTVIS